MKLRDACKIGYDCGLRTIEEAIFNIELHAVSLFSYSEIFQELKELRDEAKAYDPNADITIGFIKKARMKD